MTHDHPGVKQELWRVDMPRRLHDILLVILFVSVPLSMCGLTAAHAQNAAPNPGFDQVGVCSGDWDDDCPNSYYAYQQKDSATFLGTHVHPSGNRTLSIRIDELGANSLGQMRAAAHFVTYGVRPAETYRFSVWIKTKDLRGNAMIYGYGLDSASPLPEPVGHTPVVYGPAGTSVWTQLSVMVNVPANADSLVFALAASSDRSLCDSTPCGTAHFDNVEILKFEDDLDNHGMPSISNVCGDDEFLDLSTDSCRLLDTQFGFSSVPLADVHKRLPCAGTNATRINAEIRAFGGTGGRLVLPECRILLDDDIVLRSGVTLEGAGSGRTRLVRDPNWSTSDGTLLRVQGSSSNPIENVVLKDFSIEGSGPVSSEMNNIMLAFANNVLVERIESSNAGKSAIYFFHSQHVTVRHTVSHGSVQWHGIGSKDCYPSEDMDGDDRDTLVSKSECAKGVPNFWTENVAIYSNFSFDNAGMGIDSHASYAEVAGNIMQNNDAASKFPEPAHDIWVHDNVLTGSDRHGTKVANQYTIADESLTPYNQVFYRNQFNDNGHAGDEYYGMRIHRRAHNIVLIDNDYQGNGKNNKLRIEEGGNGQARVLSCSGDEIGGDGLDGPLDAFLFLNGDDERCDTDGVTNIFER